METARRKRRNLRLRCRTGVDVRPRPRFLVLVLGLVLFAGCGGGSGAALGEAVDLDGKALGTWWKVEVVLREEVGEERVEELRERVTGVLDRVDRGMSTWREDAELARFNRQEEAAAFAFSAETRQVVDAALDLARETRGAFDPTVGPLVGLWGFGPEAASGEPGAGALEQARRRVGWQKLHWDEEGRLVREVPGVELDLSGIAKGYAVDAIVADLAAAQPIGLLVEVGGEVRAAGTKAGGAPWRVGLQQPDGAGLDAVVALTAGALATSGDYRQTRQLGGRRVTHVIDPRAGRPVQTGVASASVIAPTCMEADAVATALMVLGPDEGMDWIEARPWLEAALLVRGDDGRIAGRRASSGWSHWLAPER